MRVREGFTILGTLTMILVIGTTTIASQNSEAQNVTCTRLISLVDLTSEFRPFLQAEDGQGDEWIWVTEADTDVLKSYNHETKTTAGPGRLKVEIQHSARLRLSAKVSNKDRKHTDRGSNEYLVKLSCADTAKPLIIDLNVYVADTTTNGRTNHEDWACWQFSYLVTPLEYLLEEFSHDIFLFDGLRRQSQIQFLNADDPSDGDRGQC